MNKELLDRLRSISQEEADILDGRTTIDRAIYMHGQGNTVNAGKLLASGKLITLRTHTRFIHFPEHKHDYVEVVYMCAGQTVHIINGKELVLKEGEILFLSQSCTHEVCCAQMQDVAVNFIVLPEFFSSVLTTIGEEQTPIRQFLVDCLSGQNQGPGYLHFRTSGIIPVANLAENLIFTLLTDVPNKRKSSQMTMALLFLLLTGYADTIQTDTQEQAAIFQVLQYIENENEDMQKFSSCFSSDHSFYIIKTRGREISLAEKNMDFAIGLLLGMFIVLTASFIIGMILIRKNKENASVYSPKSKKQKNL